MTEVALPVRPAPAVARVSQATAIEQSRAAAEVHAAVLVAQQCPRDVQTAIAQMEMSCRIKALAERAFYEYPRGDGVVTGATVHLARELARCWGNIQYGVAELRRDDDAGESEMQAYAWDVQTNARAATIFIVPHRRDRRGKGKDRTPDKLTDLRDIYENNANQAARRVRECIFAVLPPWFVEQAKELCNKTVEDGGDIPLPRRRSQAIDLFAQLDVSEEDIVRKLGKPVDRWTAHDVGRLGITYRSIQRGELARDEAFPPDVVTAREIIATNTPAATAHVREQLSQFGITDDREQTDIIRRLLKRPDGDSVISVKPADVARITKNLDQLLQDADPAKALDAVLAALEESQQRSSTQEDRNP